MSRKHCSWCDNSFDASVTYQIYCSVSCREEATRQKIAESYQKKRRKKLLQAPRKCKACNMSLSVYNDEDLCERCIVNPIEVKRALKDIKGLIDGSE